MLRTLTLPCFFLGAMLAGSSTTLCAQDADDVRNRRWFVDVKYGSLKPISVPSVSGRGKTRVVWYVMLKLTNKTGKARRLDLGARALTPQDKRNKEAAPGLYPEVVKAIAKVEKVKKLENVLSVSGNFDENATKRVVILFPNLTRLGNKVDVRVSGLTNTLFRAGNNVWREDTELSLKFHRIGDEDNIGDAKVIDKGKSWVTLSRKKLPRSQKP